MAKFLGWLWIIGLVVGAAVVITRPHEWETVLIVLGILASVPVVFTATFLAIRPIFDLD